MRTVLILGAGFGGLELAACLSESFVDEVRIVLVDKNDSFTFGFSKLEILFNGQSPHAVRLPVRGPGACGCRVPSGAGHLDRATNPARGHRPVRV